LWATCLCDWFDDHGFSLLNPLLTPTWRVSREGEHDLVLDLILANEAALWMGHMGPVEISEAESLGSDHVALLFSVLPSDHPSHIPNPSLAGYRAEDKQRQVWIKTFSSTLPYEPMAIPSDHTTLDRERMIKGLTDPACIHMTQLNSHILSGEVGPAGDLEDVLDCARLSEMCEDRLWRRLKAFDHTIDTANRKNLKPKRNPNLWGVCWWNEECMAARALVYHTLSGETCHQAFRKLHHTIKKAKQTWANNLLNSVDSAADIWHMAKVHKGQVNNVFPALRREDSSLAENP
jgi:hypothetical protein